ncbi:caspase family protein [Usitatibacter palustris]|uniref:Caspase family p20 domain-containing protein n=1 Tax=Usitatibacter palustris TaxID=2732487 RepID=A0A6M4H328_9PROT|nr:caspase family protein [Usitatibacter palustris]QJR13712.1 hypothetical protein DSM104440_00502 [Usitatibacter palustris]
MSDNFSLMNAFSNRLLALACAMLVSVASASDRVALLIGNNNYAAAPLRNAVNDARDLSEALKELGFKVIVRENTTRKDMVDAIREFGAALDGANTALFFYAGHAMQFKDRNYLVPIDAAMGSEEDVTFFSVEIGQIFDRMDRAKTRFNFLVLDACRDNPFAASFKVTSSGLAQMSSPSGTLIAYATAPGSVAADGFGRNGIYTKHILQNIKVPDLPVEIMFKRVRESVERETKKQQTPWDSSSLKGDFAFNSTGRASGGSAVASGPSADSQLQIEREFWISVRDSTRADDIQAYLDKYPSGNFSPLARNRLNALLRPGVVAAAPASAAPASASPPASPAATVPATTAPAQAVEPKPATQRAETVKDVAKAEAKPEVVAAAPASTAATAPSRSAAITAPAMPTPKPPEQPGREIAPGVREIEFSDGSIYRGGMRGTALHGKGEYVSKAFQYQGEFKEGQKHGAGLYNWENGDRYEGEFIDDRPSGKGKYKFSNGDAYEGDVLNGVIVGRGTYVSKNGDTFEGSFTDGRPNGTGVYRFATGDRYEGEMVLGKLQGRGRYFTRDGDRIEAPFVDGKPQGKGNYHFSNKDRYEGDINGGVLSGDGAYYYSSGAKYEGQVKEGRPQGKGVFWFTDGSRFEGEFDNGLARAKGEIIRADGTRAPGEIVEGNAKVLN